MPKMSMTRRTITRREVIAGTEIHKACMDSFRFSFLLITRRGRRSLRSLITLKILSCYVIGSIERIDAITIVKSSIFAGYFRYDFFPLKKNPYAVTRSTTSEKKIAVVT